MTPLEIALERIEECRSTRSTELDLSGLGLDEIPEQVFELMWLEKLDVSGDWRRRNNIREIPPAIQQLTALTEFTGTFNQINDLNALAHVPNLQALYCSSNQISDLTALAHVPNLQTLHCGLNKISNLSALAHVPNLQTLDCGGNKISDLSALVHVPNLQMLYCDSTEINDLSALVHVPNLQILHCGYNKISDLSALAYVPNLQILDCGANQITDLGALAHIPNLQVLDCTDNQIRNLSTLSNVPNLKTLSFAANKISDLNMLSHVPNLKNLSCGENNINNLSALLHVPHLRGLSFDDNKITDFSSIYGLVMSGQLKWLYADGNPALGIPSGILYAENGNCIENLRNYWQDLGNGSEKQQQFKVQLVGNGRVGKTTLAYALEHKHAPNELFKPTHGIVIKEIQQALDGEDEPVTLQLWDFGGQEIYHATHRLFLSDDCLYLLLWAEETEEHPYETRHPVSYWLEAIHDLAPNSPVILVKNQIDRSDRLPTRPAELTDDMPGVSQIRQEVKISAKQYRGMPTLRGAIESVIEELKHKVCLELPTSWLQVQRELKQLDQNTIPFTHFKQLCIKAGIDHAEWFVGYLHKTGVLFYQEGAFQDQIILNQDWAIKAVYRVFDPQDQRSFIEDDLKGRFKARHAKIVWPDASETERNIYLDFMRNCGICYESNHKHDTPFADRTFIIPALLPENSTARVAWHKSDKDWQLDIEYPFLHRSIIERIILRLGETYQGEPWRTGIFCHTDEGQLLLECKYADKQQSTQGRLHFQLRGSQLERLVYALRKLVSETSPHRRYSEFLSKAGEERIPLPEFKDEEKERTSRLDDTRPVDKPVNLFISYSKEDEAHLKPLKTRLDGIKRTLPLSHWSDHQLQAGGLVHQDILRQLETADIVVLLVSPDFIATDYCFDIEMQKALQLCEKKKNIVIPIIVRETPGWMDYAIGNLTALPTKGRPLKKWDDPDDFWASVQTGIQERVAELSGKRK